MSAKLPGGHRYRGETAFLVFQNLHRYALYFAVIFIFLLAFITYYFVNWKLLSFLWQVG